jgi:hypothetical protein
MDLSKYNIDHTRSTLPDLNVLTPRLDNLAIKKGFPSHPPTVIARPGTCWEYLHLILPKRKSYIYINPGFAFRARFVSSDEYNSIPSVAIRQEVRLSAYIDFMNWVFPDLTARHKRLYNRSVASYNIPYI